MSTTYYKHRDAEGVVHIAERIGPSEEHLEDHDRTLPCKPGLWATKEELPQAEKGAKVTCLTCLAETDSAVLILLT